MHPTAAAGFGTSADAYERGRPSYPDAAVAHLAVELGLGPAVRVVDLAAGTGKLTRLLAQGGAEVVAVEPVAAMRKALARSLPGVDVLEGTAESIRLPSGSVDAVTVAQAFHWFDAPRALAELGRVLRPSGTLLLVWNDRDERVPWVEEYSAIVHAHDWQAGLGPVPSLQADGLDRNSGLRHGGSQCIRVREG